MAHHAVTYLRHEHSTYDVVVAQLDTRGHHGRSEAYVVIRRRIHDLIAASLVELAEQCGEMKLECDWW